MVVEPTQHAFNTTEGTRLLAPERRFLDQFFSSLGSRLARRLRGTRKGSGPFCATSSHFSTTVRPYVRSVYRSFFGTIQPKLLVVCMLQLFPTHLSSQLNVLFVVPLKGPVTLSMTTPTIIYSGVRNRRFSLKHLGAGSENSSSGAYLLFLFSTSSHRGPTSTMQSPRDQRTMLYVLHAVTITTVYTD